MKINLQPQKAWKQPVLKSLHLVSMFALILNMSMLWVFMPQAAYAVTPVNPTPEPNPPFSESCGLDIGLVFDISGSINSTEMSQMKTAFQAFTTAFNGTPTQFSLTKFATNASVVQAFTDDISLINSKITSDIPGSGNGWTNWEDGLTKTHSLFDPRESKPDVIIFASDGNPNTTGTNGNANGGAAGETAAVNAAVLVANTIKTDTSHGEPQGIRIIALGIGANADGGDPALNVENLKKISGPNVDAGDITSDVITADFDQLAGTMSDLANQLCGGKILIQKQYDADADGVVDYDGSANNAALAGWTFEVNSTQKTTDDTGYLSFDVLNGTYSAVETNQKPDTEFIDATCEKGDQPIGTPTTNGVAGLTMETDDTIYCEFINSVSIYCGDGIKNGDEQCDGTDGVGPHQTCTEQCTLVDLTYCGDGAKQTPNDEGTGGPLNNGYEDCDGTDGVGAHQTCNSQCTLVDLTYCGDGTKQTPNDEGTGGPSNDGYEDCDGTDGVGAHQTCNAQCTLVDLTYCGDGAKQTPNDEGTGGPLNNGYEDCDGTDGVGAHQTCNSQCTLVDLTYCGDGTKQTPNDEGTGGPSNDGYEDCDGTDGVGFNQECTAQCTINELTCDLVITKSVDKTNTQPGEILTYTLNYINNGTGICTGTGVKIYDPLDNKVSYVNGSRSIQILNDTEGDGYHATEGNDYNGTNKTLIYNVNRVSPGESGSITFEATVNNFDGCGESIIPNRGKIWSNQTNYIWSNYVYTTANKNCEGELTVIKHVVGDDASASDWTMNITGPENDSFAGSENGVSRTLDQGDYNVAESNGSSNYTLSYSGNCDANGDVSISHGDNKTCTLTNTRDEGTITVNKFVEYPDGSTDYNPADWAWYLNGGDALTGGTTKTIPTNVMQNVSEDMTHYPEDNYYTTWTCNTVGDVVTPIANGTGTTFNIKATYHGHDIVCTFTNTRITTEVTFDKVVVGGEHEDSAWAFAIDGNGAYHEGDYAVLPINEQYVVTETSSYDALYTLTGASGICELVDGKIMLNTNAGNDFNVCIVENTRNTGSIGGTKFSDLNGNGVQNTGEPVIEGVEIKLDNSMSTTTDANGAYLFENLPTGLYEVMEVVPINWFNTTQNPVVNVEVIANQTTIVDFGNQEEVPTITLIKNITKSELMPGGYINYTLNYENTGNVTLTNVVIIDDYPQIYVTVTNPGTATDDGDMLTWKIGTLTPGQTGSVSYAVSINENTPENTEIINIATITSDQTNPLTATATALIPLPKEEGDPILTIKKNVNVEWANPGDTVTYSVTITNTGDETAYNVELTDLLPTGFRFAEYFTNQYTWNLGDLAAGKNTTVTYNVTVGEDVKPGTYENLAVASADNHGNVTDKVDLEIRAPKVLAEEADPILTIDKTVAQEFINQGDSVEYTVIVTNIGDEDAEAVAINVNVQDVMPAGFTFEDGEVTKVWTLGDIRSGESKEIKYTAISDVTLIPGQYDNLAIAWADNHDKVSDTVGVDVRKPVVLGAEALPTTGGSFLTYLYFFIAGLVILFAAYIFKLTITKERS